MTKKNDAKFAQAATDPACRLTQIAELSKLRTKFLCVAVLLSLLTIVIIASSTTSANHDLSIFICCFMWMRVYSYDANLKLLRVLQQQYDDKKAEKRLSLFLSQQHEDEQASVSNKTSI